MSGSNGKTGRNGTAIKKGAFLAAYRECGTIRHAAEAAEIGRQTHYNWMEADSQYSKDFADAAEDAGDNLEAEARRRAIDGVMQLKFHQGQPIYVPCEKDDPEAKKIGEGKDAAYVKHYREYTRSDTLLIFLMKGAMPDKYRERSTVKVEDDGERVAGQSRYDAIRNRAMSMLEMIQPKSN